MLSQSKAGLEDFAMSAVTTDKKRTRAELLDTIDSIGLSSAPFGKYTTEQLEQLVNAAEWLQRVHHNERDASNSSNRDSGSISLTDVDKKMLQTLLTTSGRISSLSLSRKLDIPLTTVQRRRKRLEGELLEVSYSLNLDKLGLRKVSLLISTSHGRASAVGTELLSHSAITKVSRSIGEHTIDLHAEMIFKDNRELMHVIEWVKALEGVNDVVWTEPVSVIGKKNMAVLEKVLNGL
jgi:DNA-binding Lrp family transcriptional regulator